MADEKQSGDYERKQKLNSRAIPQGLKFLRCMTDRRCAVCWEYNCKLRFFVRGRGIGAKAPRPTRCL
ncbi:MAG: hypothetical protein GF353_01760 [Candidatus Lokiarchaeota archaeon]|nr:hypothetical protein [Candidatus Lokiarchaeota archaeon]